MIHLVTLDFPPDVVGGIASWAEDLARAIHDRGEAVTVYAKYTGRSSEYDTILPFPVMRMQGRSWGRWKAVWVRAQVVPRLRKGDIVLFATWPLAVLAGPIAAQKGCRVGVFAHGSEVTELQSTPLPLRFLVKHVHTFFGVSEFLVDQMKGHGIEAIRVPMPLPLGPGPGAPGRGLVAVARLNKRKGLDRAIRLAKALDWPLTVVGDGPARPGLEVVQIETGAQVEFVGRLPRVRALDAYQGKAASLLLPRTHPNGTGGEGLGLTLLEAASQGVPAVGCATGGVPEAADLVLDDPDDAQASAEQLRTWLKGGPRGQQAYDRVRAEHGPKACLAVLESLWT